MTRASPPPGSATASSSSSPSSTSIGRTRLMFRVSLVYALVHLPVFIAGTVLYGLTGAIGGVVLAGVLYVYLNAWLLWKTVWPVCTMKVDSRPVTVPSIPPYALNVANGDRQTIHISLAKKPPSTAR